MRGGDHVYWQGHHPKTMPSGFPPDYAYDPCSGGHSDDTFEEKTFGLTFTACRRCGREVRNRGA